MRKGNLLLRKNILTRLEIQKILSYIKERECVNGGYCFYRQEEPNVSDTYFAFATLNLLENDFQASIPAITYLKKLQSSDGTYIDLIQAYYIVHALSILNDSPMVDASRFVLKNLQSFSIQNLPTEISVYRKIYYIISLVTELKVSLSSKLQTDVIGFILSFKNQDFGFGSSNKSTLIETMQALQILKSLNYPISKIKGVDNFISECISPNLLYTNMPNIFPSFMEHVNAGHIVSRTLARKPELLDTSIRFIRGCQTSLGGFSRAPFTGIATLEYTYYAVSTLNLIAEYM
ncbi:MAG: prenyltransferase/squalene oxidase repeat-containing protein [Candidatus Hodarchaeales archaeon]